jgi:hypothetical protein
MTYKLKFQTQISKQESKLKELSHQDLLVAQLQEAKASQMKLP